MINFCSIVKYDESTLFVFLLVHISRPFGEYNKSDSI
jgi:hypothetical protein